MTDPSPVPFQIVAGAVLLALVYHAFRLYGARVANALLVPFALVAMVKEALTRTPPYQVMIQGPLPGSVIVASGWIVVFLLGLEVGRLLGLRLGGRAARRLTFRAILVGICAAFCAHGIEPVGQLSGWWLWDHGKDFRVASPDWFGVVGTMGTIALATAAVREGANARRFVGELVAFLATLLLALGLVGRFLSPIVALLLLPVLPLLYPRLQMPATLVPDHAHLARWEQTLPALAMTSITLTLVGYALAVGADGGLAHTRGPALLTIALSALAWRAGTGERAPAPADDARRAESGASQPSSPAATR